ncbi:MAG TPA: PD-(D/E)XK nuclease family protein [Vicinamibacterales bacterium]|nr:PD-(D/E)XK nuclease family protein [Vicinamibacterales bacterium]
MQRRRLIRARDLAAFKDALVEAALNGAPADARRRAILVPTRAAAELFRQTVEARLGATRPRAALLPDVLTRAEWLERLLASLASPRRLLTRIEREVLLGRAARQTSERTRMGGAPFPLRPGLVSAMLDFYDELRRRQRTVRRMAHALFAQLKVERDTDRGSDALIHQTAFLGLSWLAYERAALGTDAIDEHQLRRLLLAEQPALPYDHLIVAVADQPSDIRGLWPADFDLLGRLAHLSRVDVVVTDAVHDAGFRARLETELPAIEEDHHEAVSPTPILIRPATAEDDPDAMCFVSRDREEELRDVARAIRARAIGGSLTDRTAIVFHRPLPYLYLAQHVLTDARVPYQAFDALPLAAEPYAALLDVVMTVARTGGTRESSVELLRSRLLRLTDGDREVSAQDVSALDVVLTERRATGDAASFPAEVEAHFRDGGPRAASAREGAWRAGRAAAGVASALRAFHDGPDAASQVRSLSSFLRLNERLPGESEPWQPRHLRARAAVLAALDGLADAFARHDNARRPDEDITAAVHHAIEAQTFTPRRGTAGVHLVDAVAARFGEFDHVHVVGLVETDWPERARRNIFYTSGLLKELGWPQQTDQTLVERAAFTDLLGLPSHTIQLSAFQLEGDAILAQSPMVELARHAAATVAPAMIRRRVFDDEAMTTAPIAALALAPETVAWLQQRHARPDLTGQAFAGFVGPQAPQRYRVSRVDHYADCPFKYFAENVLALPEERDEAAGLTPLERGQLIHQLFEQFFRDWDAAPGGSITAETLPDALARFAALTETALARLPDADRALERTRLLGSLVSPGIADRVFELEVDATGDVVRRLLESDLRGPFDFPQLGGLKTRTIEIAGKADRVDVLADRSIRVVDYKLSRLPDKESSIQIAVYAHAARTLLERAHQTPHRIAAAMYLAFGDEDDFEGSLGNRDRLAEDVVRARVEAFAGIIDRIERGEFPASPRRLDMCGWCRYAGVCRKEYPAETGKDAAQPV